MYESVMKLFSHICHQNPERSFIISGYQFPLCARCSGIYFFMLLGIVISILLLKKINIVLPILIIISISLNFITFVDGFDSNFMRLILGSILGFNIGMLYGVSIKILLKRGSK